MAYLGVCLTQEEVRHGQEVGGKTLENSAAETVIKSHSLAAEIYSAFVCALPLASSVLACSMARNVFSMKRRLLT